MKAEESNSIHYKRLASPVFVVIGKQKVFREKFAGVARARGRRKREGEKREKNIGTRCNRRIYRPHSYGRALLLYPLESWLWIKSVIYDPRACISIPQRPDYQSTPAGGRCLRLDCRQWYTAFASKENAGPLTDALRAFLFPTWYDGDVGGVFMRIAAGFPEDERPRESGFGCCRLEILRCVELHPPRRDFVSIMQIRSFRGAA